MNLVFPKYLNKTNETIKSTGNAAIPEGTSIQWQIKGENTEEVNLITTDTTIQFLAQLKAEFDQLYEEGSHKRRMMSVSLHDRIGGTPAVVNVVNQFIEYAKSHSGVVFMRKDEIANMVKNAPNTPIDNSEIQYNN